MPVPPSIPDILTKANWDEKKGVFAKMAGKTGVGEAMKAVTTAYDAVDWTKFDAMQSCPGVKQMSVIDAAYDAAKLEMKKVDALRNKVTDLGTLATQTEAKFKKNKLIPSSSTKHVANVAKAADTLQMTFKANSSWFDAANKTFDHARADLRTKQEVGRKQIKGYLHSISEDAQKVLAKPTVSEYVGEGQTGFWQGCRGLSAALAFQSESEIQEFLTKFRPMTQAQFLPTSDEEVKPKVKQVIDKLKELQELIKA